MKTLSILRQRRKRHGILQHVVGVVVRILLYSETAQGLLIILRDNPLTATNCDFLYKKPSFQSSQHKGMIVSPPSIRYFERRRDRTNNHSSHKNNGARSQALLLSPLGDNDVTVGATTAKPLSFMNPIKNHSVNNIDDRTTNATTSFTSEEYVDIAHSSNIVRIFLLHATIYYALSILGFSFIVESWPIVDSIYYATTLFCTIGFGDIAPGNTYAQLYTIGLALYGITFLGILLGAVIDYYLEYQNFQKEKRCRQVGSQVLYRLKEKQTNSQSNRLNNNIIQANDTILGGDPSLFDDIVKLLKLEIPIISVAILLAILIGHYEHWTIVESIYWFIISGTTVGFGDYYPQLSSVKLFCVMYLPFAVAVLGDLLRRIIGIYINRKRRLMEKQFLMRSLSLADLDIMDADKSGRVDKAEFLAYMLCTLQKVSKDDVNEIMELFHKLDVDDDHYLTKNDLASEEWVNTLRSSIEQSIR